MAGPENEMPRLVRRAETKFGPMGSNLLAGETHGKVKIITKLVSNRQNTVLFHCRYHIISLSEEYSDHLSKLEMFNN